MKRAFSLILAILMIFSTVTALTSCGGGAISAEDWQAAFGGENFGFSSDTNIIVYESGYLTGALVNIGTPDEPEYDYTETEFYSVTVDGVTKYYKKVMQEEPVEIEAAEMTVSRADFAPFLDFLRDNQSLFKNIGQNSHIFTYEGDLPADVKAWIDEMCETSSDFYSIEVEKDHNRGDVDFVRVYTNAKLERDQMMSSDEYDDFCEFTFYGFGSQICMPLYLESVKTIKGSNYKIVGGEGENYMEIEFDGDNMRYYTPNVAADPSDPDAEVFVEAIFMVEDGVYNYYKKSASGIWQVEALQKEDYENRVGTIRKMFGGGHLFRENDPFYSEKIGDCLESYPGSQLSIGKSGLYELFLTNIKVKLGDGFTIEGAEWNIRMQQTAMGDAVVEAGHFVMTLGNAVITKPTVN